MLNKHKEKFNPEKINMINIITLLLGFSTALTAYVISSYFKQTSGSDNVAIFYVLTYIILLAALLNLHRVIRIVGKTIVFFICLALFAASACVLLYLPVSTIGVSVLIFNIIASTLCFASKDILLESYSIDRMSGRIRGLHLTLMNLGFILAPFISMQILSRYGYKGVFTGQFIVVSLIFILAVISLRHKDKTSSGLGGKQLFQHIKARKNLLYIYYISFILDLFYFLAVVYVPIHLRNLGMPWGTIGLIFTFMLLPFILLQYPIGLIADTKIGEKKLIIFALLILALSTTGLFFINSGSIYLWGITLFMTRVGAASLEMLRDSYFYKRIDGRDVDLINFFRTTIPVAYIIGSIVSGILLVYFPLKSVFIFIALLSLTGIIAALGLIENKREKEA